jgi:hypothetical protein
MPGKIANPKLFSFIHFCPAVHPQVRLFSSMVSHEKCRQANPESPMGLEIGGGGRSLEYEIGCARSDLRFGSSFQAMNDSPDICLEPRHANE